MSQAEKIAWGSRSESFRKLNPDLFLKTSAPMATAYEMLKALNHEDHHRSALQDPIAQRDPAPTLGGAAKGKAQSLHRARVRFTGFRRKPLDPDNFAGSVKDLLDGLRHAGLLSGDEWWKIKLETEQVKVGTAEEEKTVIEIIP